MRRNLSFFASLWVVMVYLICTWRAALSFLADFSPVTNWLSDFGSSSLNPHGAIYYNIGIILTGIGLMIFFLSLRGQAVEERKAAKIMLLLTKLFGSLGAIAMILSAVFPISSSGAHSMWSACLYIFLGTAFAFSVAAFRYQPTFPRWLLALGILVVIDDLIWSLVLNIYILEWVTIFLFLVYVLLLGIQTRRQL